MSASDASTASSDLFDEAFLRRLEYLHLVSRRLLSGRSRAERRSRRAGSGIEFADHRAYAPGDDLRYLDWGAYGRLGRLLVRLFEEEEDLHIYFLVDASRSMGSASDGDRGGGGEAGASKLDQARRTAAALAYIGLANLDRVSLCVLGGADDKSSGVPTPPVRGRGQIFKLLASLASLSPSGETDLRAAVGSFVHRAPRRGLAVVLSDFYDPRGYAGALDLLRYHRFEPAVIHLVDERDLRPAALGDIELVDCETGERREVTVTPRLAAAFAREHRAFCDGLAAFCADRGLPCLLADTRVPFDELVLRVLRERGFLA